MTLYKNRDKFSGVSQAVGRKFAFAPANAYTALALVLAAAAAYFIANGRFLPAAVLFAVAAFFDMVDGAVARRRKEAGKRGAYLDSVSDRYVEAVLAFGLLFAVLPYFYVPAYFWIALYLFGSMMTTYARAVAAEKSISKDLRGGLLERGDRMILLFIGLILGVVSPLYLIYVLAALAILSNVSALQRISIALGKK